MYAITESMPMKPNNLNN